MTGWGDDWIQVEIQIQIGRLVRFTLTRLRRTNEYLRLFNALLVLANDKIALLAFVHSGRGLVTKLTISRRRRRGRGRREELIFE